MSDHMHWADNIALQVKERVESDPRLKEIVAKQGYLVYDEKTPSGEIHVGSGRGWVINDCIAKALRKLGLTATFALSSDDMDPYDKPNKDLPESFNQYLGMCFRDIPSPKPGYKSFGHYYFSQVTEKFGEWGIECGLESTGDNYEQGKFNAQIKTLLDNADKVQKIYAEIYGEEVAAANKLPFNVKCPKCKKIATTLASKWDKEKELVFFECKDGVVDYAPGCGHSGWISPYNGNGKLPWKVEWAAKWPMKGVVYETAGKDHFSDGGSRTIACRIAVDVLNYPPPLPSNGYSTGKGYEFFTVGGAKMSTSKGVGMSFKDATNYAPAKMLRYLIVKTRPNAVIDFNPYNDNDLILLYERYDEMEDIVYGKKTVSKEEEQMQKRIYELSHIGEQPKTCPPHISLNSAGQVLQIALFDEKKTIEILREQGLVEKKLSEVDEKAVRERLQFAKKWIQDFASEQYKFTIQEEVGDSAKAMLSEQQKKALAMLAEKLLGKKYKEKELHDEFYAIKDAVGISTQEFFQAAYQVLIKKDKGPRLASFILAIGQEKVAQLLTQVEG